MDRGTRLSSLVCAVPQFFLSCLHTAFLACACSILDAFLALTTLRILHVASTPCAFLGGPNKGAQMLYQIRLGSRLARLTWQRQGYNLKPGASLYCWVTCMRHLRIGRAEPVGKGRSASLRPSTFCAYSALSMLGCVLNWYPSFAPVSIITRTRACASSSTCHVALLPRHYHSRLTCGRPHNKQTAASGVTSTGDQCLTMASTQREAQPSASLPVLQPSIEISMEKRACGRLMSYISTRKGAHTLAGCRDYSISNSRCVPAVQWCPGPPCSPRRRPC